MSDVKQQVLTMQKTIARYFSNKNYAVARECGIPTVKTDPRTGEEYVCFYYGNRRADVIAINKKKEVVIVETKSSKQDFNSDKKWKEYLKCCHKFYFAALNEDVAEHILSKLKEESMHRQVGLILFVREPMGYWDTGLRFMNGAKRRDCDQADEVVMRMLFRLSPFSMGKYIGSCFEDKIQTEQS